MEFFAGIMVGWLVAFFFYRRSSQDLKKEASELRKQNTLIMRAMEEKGDVEFNRDKQGEIIGLVVKLKSRIKVGTKISNVELGILEK